MAEDGVGIPNYDELAKAAKDTYDSKKREAVAAKASWDLAVEEAKTMRDKAKASRMVDSEVAQFEVTLKTAQEHCKKQIEQADSDHEKARLDADAKEQKYKAANKKTDPAVVAFLQLELDKATGIYNGKKGEAETANTNVIAAKDALDKLTLKKTAADGFAKDADTDVKAKAAALASAQAEQAKATALDRGATDEAKRLWDEAEAELIGVKAQSALDQAQAAFELARVEEEVRREQAKLLKPAAPNGAGS